MAIHETVAEIADEIAEGMYNSYMNGSNEVQIPELKYVVFTLMLQYNEDRLMLTEWLERDIVTRYNEMR